MKRSEMIELIIEVLLDKQCFWPDTQAKHILEAIEEAGMLPPINPTLKASTIAAGEANEWEPENE